MKAIRSTTVSPRPTQAAAPDAVTEAILARGRAVLEVEAAAIGDACSRLGDAFVGAVQAILDCKGRVCVTGIGKAEIGRAHV